MELDWSQTPLIRTIIYRFSNYFHATMGKWKGGKKVKIRKNILAFIILFITCTATANAKAITAFDDKDFEVVAETTKYYKTVSILSNSEVMTVAGLGELSSITTEISEEEYLLAANNDGISPNTSITTNYKKLTSTISKNSAYNFKYAASLTWLNMPTVRSYDIIGMGYYASVKAAASANFKQTYCTSSTNCTTQNSGYYYYEGNNGVGAMFKVPSGSLTSLKQELVLYVEKTDPSKTIVSQLNAADYSHAGREVSYNTATDFFVDGAGIKIGAGFNSYEDLNTADTKWQGTW